MKGSLLDIVFPIQDNHLPAVIYHDGQHSITICYGDVFEATRQLSEELSSLLSTNCVVVLAIQQLHFLVPLLALGVLKLKSAFMYLDSNLPVTQQRKLLESSKASIIISDSENIMVGWKIASKLILLGTHELHIFQESHPTEAVVNPLPEEWTIAYLIHTSGSTGVPKIVRVPHSCILPNILDLRMRFEIQKSDILFAASPFSFDPSIVDLFLALSTGARLVIVKPSIKSMPSLVADIIRTERVTFLQATPSFLLQFGPKLSKTHLLHPTSTLRTIVLGGEPFPSFKTIEEYRSPENSTTFYNIYGITEVSCWASLYKIDFNEKVELGCPLSETEFRVVNEQGEEINQGEGFLILGGRRSCLVDNETPQSLEKPVFRETGDRVELVNGKLYYRGRTDATVKRMGKRLNLHSVELIAHSSGLVQQCCALLDSNQLLILVCSGCTNVEELRNYFQINASTVQQPDDIHVLDSIPVSKHAKIDRQKCLEIIQTTSKCQITEWQSCLKSKWMSLTGQQSITDDANFILTGGNSLSALNLVSKIQDYVTQPLPLLVDILLNKNYKDVVDYIEKEMSIHQFNSVEHPPVVKIFQRCQPAQLTVVTSKPFELKQIWKFNLKKCIDASPLIIRRMDGGGTVYIGSHSHLFSGVNLEDGQEKWTTELPERIESSACCDPAGMRIFVGCYDGKLYCLDALNGQIFWQFSTGDAIKSSPVCTGSSIIFGSHDRTLYSLSILKGDLLWQRTISSGSLFASPSWDGQDCILSASLDGTCSALTVSSGQLLWTIQLKTPVFSSPVWCPGSDRCLLASVDGLLHCCRAGEIIWRFQAAGPIFSTPSVVDNRIVFGSHDHSLYCLDQDNGGQLWRVQFTSPVYSSPFSGSLVICSDTNGYLRVVELSNGRLLAQTRLDGQVFSSPVLVEQSVVVGCRDDYLYCFRLTNHL